MALAIVSLTATVVVGAHVGEAGGSSHVSSAPAPRGRVAMTPRATSAAAVPSAAEFTRIFVGVTNDFAAEHGDPVRVVDAQCVEGAPGRYMCSYTATKPRGLRECFLMQARWTPGAASTFTVTLAGRTAGCGSVREAIRSLG